MSKKILLLTSLIFLSSCAATTISELGDKFLDLYKPSDAPTEVTDLGEEVFVAYDDSAGFTFEELEILSNDELIEIAKEKGLEDILKIDDDGNLQNRDQIINALLKAKALLENATQELQTLSNDALIERAEEKGMESVIVLEELETLSNDELIEIAKEKGFEDILKIDDDINLQNRDQIIDALLETEASAGFTLEELEVLSNDELIEIAKEKGLEDTLVLDVDSNLQNKEEVIKILTDNLIILDEDGNVQNKDEVIEALRKGAEETKVAVLLLENTGISSTIYFGFDDTEIDELATRIIIQHAKFMQNNPSFNLRLEGHADERGTREYNLALGENRALSVKEVLGLYNLEDRIVVVSYGEEQPILTDSNEEAWRKNRRVSFSYY